MTSDKKPARRSRSRGRSRGRRSTASTVTGEGAGTPAAEPAVETAGDIAEAELVLEPPTPEMPAEEFPPPELPETSIPEPAFAARVVPAAPRPMPPTWRAIFFDVENTSRPDHIARVLAHLAIEWTARRTELIAVGNWRVVSHETARMLARHGAHLVHSAPSVGVRDWSDLRIAVGAGVWLAGARPGDSIEVVSDDQAFDAVGDVATSLGVAFRRLSYRALAGVLRDLPIEEPAREDRAPRRRRRGSRRGGDHRDAPPRHAPARSHAVHATHAAPPPGNGEESGDEVHSAPPDEIVEVVRALLGNSPDRGVSIDALTNALKARGFRRPPGSLRLITRLRRIKELDVSRNGTIRLVGSAAASPPDEVAESAGDDAYEPEGVDLEPPGESGADDAPAGDESAAPRPGQRRRRRRGGRRRRGRGGGSQAVVAVP